MIIKILQIFAIIFIFSLQLIKNKLRGIAFWLFIGGFEAKELLVGQVFLK